LSLWTANATSLKIFDDRCTGVSGEGTQIGKSFAAKQRCNEQRQKAPSK